VEVLDPNTTLSPMTAALAVASLTCGLEHGFDDEIDTLRASVIRRRRDARQRVGIPAGAASLIWPAIRLAE
jgi:hypothetical protein